MKKTLHSANTRGHANHGWLDSYHTFSFASYYDPERVHFGLLRVLNDDTIDGGTGFGRHPHDNMEIVTIPISGSIEHEDSTGRHAVIGENDVQIMSAGSGIQHSEYNHHADRKTHFLQTWVFPKERNIKPRYEQKTFAPDERKNRLLTVVSPEKDGNALWINQDAWYTLGNLDQGQEFEYRVHKDGNGTYIFLIEGEAEVAEEKLSKRDGLGISGAASFDIKALSDCQLLLMEVPMH